MPDTAAPLATKRKHYHDIDGARSVLMFLSVALHAGTVYAPARPWITQNTQRAEFFDWLIFGFHLFITPTFFFVGGFFAVLLLKRRTIGDFLQNRLLRTGVPLITIALTLNMVEHYLRWLDASGSDQAAGTGVLDWLSSAAFVEVWAGGTWQLHLWFLVSLLPMFGLAALVHGVLARDSWVRAWGLRFADTIGKLASGSVPFAFFLLGLAAINTANYAVASQIPGAYDLIIPGFQTWYKLISEFPFFVIGVLAALSPRFLSSLLEWRVWMPFAAALALGLQPYPDNDAGLIAGAVGLFANQLAMWTLVLFILQFFHRFFNEGGARTQWLADCALSMYLFHHCLVYIYGRILVPFDAPIALEFTILVVASAGTVIAIHEGLVRRVAVMRLLFNGKTDLEQTRQHPGLLEAFRVQAWQRKISARIGLFFGRKTRAQ